MNLRAQPCESECPIDGLEHWPAMETETGADNPDPDGALLRNIARLGRALDYKLRLAANKGLPAYVVPLQVRLDEIFSSRSHLALANTAIRLTKLLNDQVIAIQRHGLLTDICIHYSGRECWLGARVGTAISCGKVVDVVAETEGFDRGFGR